MKINRLLTTFMVSCLWVTTGSAAELATTVKPVIDIDKIDTLKPTLTVPQCEVALKLLQEKLPSNVGDLRAVNQLLQIKPVEWRGRMKVDEFLGLLSTEFTQAANLPKSFSSGQLQAKDALLKYTLSKGMVRYANHTRMLIQLDAPPAVDEESGMKMVLNLADSLGIVREEMDLQSMKSNVLKAGIASANETSSVRPAIDVERTYFIPRKINGIEVQDSMMIVGINNFGELAHFRLKWPVLKIAQAESKSVVKREDLLSRVHQWVQTNDNQCDKTPTLVNMHLAYVPVNAATDDENDQSDEQLPEPVFVPKLIVNYMPASTEEETGNANQGGYEESFDLF